MDTGVNVEELNCKACQTDITAVYLTELMGNVETLKKENAARKEQTKAGKLGCVIFPPIFTSACVIISLMACTVL